MNSTGKQPFARNSALDALRGLAILGMVLSGAFPHELPWPGWMFHAQVGPPDFKYKPDIPGITWVDLVFPFFLFAMGTAIPIALAKKVDAGSSGQTIQTILKRFLLLVFFAITIRHLNPYSLGGTRVANLLTGILAFGAYFLVFLRFKTSKSLQRVLRITGLGMIAGLIAAHHFLTEKKFDLYRSDIIILVLANMALFGSVIWVLTRKNLLARLGVLVIIAGIRLTYEVPDSWNEAVWNFHPSIGWLYRFDYLKYLFIIIPGTVLGDLLLSRKHEKAGAASPALALICLVIVVVNVYCLYTRMINPNLLITLLLLLAGYFTVKRSAGGSVHATIFEWGIFWTLAGLSFEAYAGGIKKDPSSFSYWLLTSGLACFTWIFFDTLLNKADRSGRNFLVICGQNPMVAYIAGSFLIWPLLDLLGIKVFLDDLKNVNVYLGIVKTVVLTGLVIGVTVFVTRKNLYWRT